MYYWRKLQRFTEIKYENYIRFQELFLAIEDLNLHQGL